MHGHHGDQEPGVGLFPSADQLPLGQPYGRVDSVPQGASPVRPFGLTLAVKPRTIRFDPAGMGYDDHLQIGLIRHGCVMVPLAKHTDGTTNTQTSADGQTGPDSDTDYRED